MIKKEGNIFALWIAFAHWMSVMRLFPHWIAIVKFQINLKNYQHMNASVAGTA